MNINFKKEVSEEAERNNSLNEWPNAKVLVVDDNRMNRIVLGQILKMTKVQTDNAESGFACLDMTKAQHYDLILMDHMMPEMDGIETSHQIKSDNTNPCCNTPIVIVTANAMDEDREKYLEMGFVDYLSKPIIPAELIKIMNEALN